MKFGSVCSGIEAASVAWHGLGWEAAWVAEVDVSASAVLAHRLGATAPCFPVEGSEKSLKRIQFGERIINWGDMTRLPEAVRTGAAEAPDILCGGTPCQAYSIAGKREGLSDPRGQLTLKFVELADAIDDIRIGRDEQPCVVFWENVPGVLSSKDNAFGCFLADLAGEDVPLEPPGKRWSDAGVVLGPKRAIAWRSLDSQFFALAQRRRRVFLVASAREGFDPASVLLEFDGLRRDSAPSRDAGEGFTHALAPCLTSSGRGVERTGDPRGQDAVVACYRSEPPAELTPQWWDGSPVSQTLDAVLHKGQTMPEKNRFPAVLQPVIPILEAGARTGNSTTDPRAGIGIGIDGDPMFTLQSSKQHAVAVMPFNTTQITSPENGSNPQWGDPCFSLAAGNHPPAVAISVALRGREGGSTAELGDDVAGTLRASGGGDKPHVLAFSSKDYGNDVTADLAPTMRAMNHSGSHQNGGGQLAVCVTGDITHTLTSEGFDASEDGTGRGQPIIAFAQNTRSEVRFQGGDGQIAGTLGADTGMNQTTYLATDMAVRRLMPVECESLQGFPRNWTLVPVGKGVAADGPRYKQLGNSWAVPCVTWIGKRLDRHLAELDGMIIDVAPVQSDAMTIWMCAA